MLLVCESCRESGDASAALELRVSQGPEADLGGATATALSQALKQVRRPLLSRLALQEHI